MISNGFDALLSDFGLSKLRHEVTRTFSRNSDSKEGGSVRYLAPEMFAADTIRVTAASDRYALAMTFLELVTLDRPFAEITNEFAVIGAVCAGRRPRPPHELRDLHHWQGNILWELLESIWRQEPTERLSMHAIEDHLARLNLYPALATNHASHEQSLPVPPQENEAYSPSWPDEATAPPSGEASPSATSAQPSPSPAAPPSSAFAAQQAALAGYQAQQLAREGSTSSERSKPPTAGAGSGGKSSSGGLRNRLSGRLSRRQSADVASVGSDKSAKERDNLHQMLQHSQVQAAKAHAAGEEDPADMKKRRKTISLMIDPLTKYVSYLTHA